MTYFPGWTDDTVAELKRLAALNLSAGMIGRRLGVTKNAIVGACVRRGIKLGGDSVAGAENKRKRRVAPLTVDTTRSESTYAAPSNPRRFSWEEPLDTRAQPA